MQRVDLHDALYQDSSTKTTKFSFIPHSFISEFDFREAHPFGCMSIRDVEDIKEAIATSVTFTT
jgi:hypothetical protein